MFHALAMSICLSISPTPSGENDQTELLRIKQAIATLHQIEELPNSEKSEADLVQVPWATLTISLLLAGFLHEVDLIPDHWFWPTTLGSSLLGFGYVVVHGAGLGPISKKLDAIHETRRLYKSLRPGEKINSELLSEATNLIVRLSIFVDHDKLNTSFERWHYLRAVNSFLTFFSELELLGIDRRLHRFMNEAVDQVYHAVQSILDRAHDQNDFPLARKALSTRNRILGFKGAAARAQKRDSFADLARKLDIAEDDLTEYTDAWEATQRNSVSRYRFVSKVDPQSKRITLERIMISDEIVFRITTPTELLPADPAAVRRLAASGKVEEKLGPGLWVSFPQYSENIWTYIDPSEQIPQAMGLIAVAIDLEGTILPSRRLSVFPNAFSHFGDIPTKSIAKKSDAREFYPWVTKCLQTIRNLPR